jgi:hypothetical protein
MKNKTYLLLLFFSLTVFSQHKTLEITNIKTGKAIVIEENQRSKTRTVKNKKWIENLKISDSLTFIINNQYIKIDSLQSLKKQPKSVAVIKKTALISGLAMVGTATAKALQSDESSLKLFAIGVGTTISARIIEGLNSNFTARKYSFKIFGK